MVMRVSNIKRHFQMGEQKVEALKGITFDVQKGEFISIMGPSGSGKTTLMNIIGCLDTPSSGDYYLNGELVSDLDESYLAKIRNKDIGFVFQSFHLLPRNSALDNVLLPLKYAGMNSNEAIERAKLVINRVGLGDRMDHSPAELSGGQQQRVAIARAIVNKPAILFADEPTGNLDSKTGDEVMDLFKELNEQGQTIILITHEDDIAQQSKRIINIKDGLIESDIYI
jgi:putative ABC transport system ATP-binding protein